MKNVLLICGSFTSANFYVMLSVIRAIGDVHIHAISAYNEDKIDLPHYDDVTYHHVHNWRKSLLDSIQRIPAPFLSRGLEYIYHKTTNLYDTIATSSYERKIYRDCLKIVEEEKIDAIFSVCLRFYTHRIATKLRAKIGIKWYQFWVDPYSNRREGGKLWRRLAERVEKKFFEDADKIYALPEVFVGSKLIEPYKHKLVSFEIPYLENRDVEQTTREIIFAGGFLKRIREPYPVLNILLSITNDIDKDIKFHFYVKHKEQFANYTEQSGGVIQFHDYIGHDELYHKLANSYMLLNIGNAGSIQMPSKTVEYVSFRKPMLFFYKDPHDPSLRYLEDYPDICRINVDDPIEENRHKLLGFFRQEHPAIAYSDLMKIDVFRESTPEYINQILGDTRN